MFSGEGKIRVKSLCLFEKDERLFVSEMTDIIKGDTYYRPIGGTIEFGEHSRMALTREVYEELGVEIHNVDLSHVFENIFICDGKQGHEVVFMYRAEFKDHSYYDEKTFWLTESNGEKIPAYWIPITKFVTKELRLVPEDLLDMFIKRSDAIVN